MLQHPAGHRLPFRELGLSIGLKGAGKLRNLAEEHPRLCTDRDIALRVAALAEYLPLAERIESFWLDHQNRRGGTWSEHRDINMVMLATSLAPEAFLSV